MKQTICPRLLVLAVTFVQWHSAFGTTSQGLACPQKYIATVTNVAEIRNGIFPKVEVDFQVVQMIKGEQIPSKKIQILKNGPVEFKSGEVYTIESRENWLCSAALFSKN